MDPEQTESLTKIFAQGVFNPLGLHGFTKLFVLYSGKEIGDILRLCLDTTKHPILLHCTSGMRSTFLSSPSFRPALLALPSFFPLSHFSKLGKDRTGLVAALVLYICGVSKDDIIDSYHLSEVYLMPIFEQFQKDNR